MSPKTMLKRSTIMSL